MVGAPLNKINSTCTKNITVGIGSSFKKGSNIDDLWSQVHLLSHLGSSQRMLAWMVVGPPAETTTRLSSSLTFSQTDSRMNSSFIGKWILFSLKSFLRKIYFCTIWKVDGATPMYCIGLSWPLTNRHLLGVAIAIYFHYGVNVSQQSCELHNKHIVHIFELCSTPWLVVWYRGLYYPIIWGL